MSKIIDANNNIIDILENGKVLLKLSSENRVRRIGTFKDNVYVKSDTEKHIFRKLNAWSVPYELFKRSRKLMIITDVFVYTFNIKDIDPTILHFKGVGIEKKVYIPLDYWEKQLKI
jgi:hypothetical protein